MINFFKDSFGNLYIFKKVDKIINDVPLKSLTFQTGQKSGTEGVLNFFIEQSKLHEWLFIIT